MTTLLRTTLIALSTCLTLGSGSALADHERHDDPAELLLSIASSFLIQDAAHQRGYDRSARLRHDRGFNRPRTNPGYEHRARNSKRQGFGASFTSEPIRGGSSRRTRIIANPYPDRPITGISFTGIERNEVHINDVITYPRKRLVSNRGYSLSLYHPSPFLSARGYVDYISVKAKRKEYFTVTFHYD